MRFRDPVCGMEIRWEEAVGYAVVGPLVVYFCCPGCASRFRQDPSRHVNVERWLSEDPPPIEAAGCDGNPLDLAGGDVVAHRSLSTTSVPTIGRLSLDDFEALVVRRWRHHLGRGGGQTLQGRVLERALLVSAMADGGQDHGHEVDRMLAAEVVRLRSKELERDRIDEELRALPAALAEALRVAQLEPDRRQRLLNSLQRGVDEVRDWIDQSPAVTR